MMKKIIAASLALALMVALMPASYAVSGNAKHYNGIVGADSPFYPVKTGLQKLDVMLTFNNTEKLKKQMSLADERIAEAQDAADGNNTGAYDAATGEYINTLNDINGTLQSEDVDPEVATELVPVLLHHKEVFYGLIDNNTTPLTIQNRTVLINGEFMKIKNGMPFYYYNGTAYFMPPGQMKKIENGIINGSKVPPGLEKKGYKNASFDKNNKTWPWDQIPYPTSEKTNGNGKGNPNK